MRQLREQIESYREKQRRTTEEITNFVPYSKRKKQKAQSKSINEILSCNDTQKIIRKLKETQGIDSNFALQAVFSSPLLCETWSTICNLFGKALLWINGKHQLVFVRRTKNKSLHDELGQKKTLLRKKIDAKEGKINKKLTDLKKTLKEKEKEAQKIQKELLR